MISFLRYRISAAARAMIHSPPRTEETLSEITPEKPATKLPADYYSSPERNRRIVPRGVTLGCGTAALIILILMFMGGAFINGGGGTRLVQKFFGQLQGELLSQCSKDVRPEQKTTFAAEFSQLQQRVGRGKVKSDDLLEMFRMIRDDSQDGVVTPAELDALTKKIHAMNAAR